MDNSMGFTFVKSSVASSVLLFCCLQKRLCLYSEVRTEITNTCFQPITPFDHDASIIHAPLWCSLS